MAKTARNFTITPEQEEALIKEAARQQHASGDQVSVSAVLRQILNEWLRRKAKSSVG
jgi:hypothetical protein